MSSLLERWTKGAVALAIVVVSMPAGPRAHAADCSNLDTQMAMNECAGHDQEKLDTQLTALYGRIHQRLKSAPDTAKLLTISQRAWIAFRDTECAFSASGVQGGSIYPMIVSLCRQRLTQSRISDFKGYLDCKEFDFGCPVPSN